MSHTHKTQRKNWYDCTSECCKRRGGGRIVLADARSKKVRFVFVDKNFFWDCMDIHAAVASHELE